MMMILIFHLIFHQIIMHLDSDQVLYMLFKLFFNIFELIFVQGFDDRSAQTPPRTSLSREAYREYHAPKIVKADNLLFTNNIFKDKCKDDYVTESTECEYLVCIIELY